MEAETWSALWFDDFIEQLGYQKTPSLKIYWLLPRQTIQEGLRIIESDRDTNVMSGLVHRIKNFVVYFDHEDIIGGVWDDIVEQPVIDLPKVLSPVKVTYVEKKAGEKLPVFYTNLGKQKVQQCASDGDGGGDSNDTGVEDDDFVDTDYEMEDGDADLFENYEDGHVQLKDNKKAKGSALKAFDVSRPDVDLDDVETDDEGLELPDSNGEGTSRLRFTQFRDEDMSNPTFSVGLVFSTVEKLREAIGEYSVRNRVEIKMPRNDRIRVKAHCVEGCPWNLYASFDSRMKSFVVKTYYGRHTCQKEWSVRKCTAKWIAAKYLDAFRAHDKMSISSLGKTVQKDWNFTPSRSKLARARRLIMREIHGDEVMQFNSLWDYGQELRRSNPGSSFYLNLAGNLFNTCYMSIDACKRGFLAGCRPIICLDGCFIKTKYGGQLLTTVGMDPNDCIFPIAMAVVEVESLATWKWFLKTLKDDLKIENTYPWTIMTDKQKVSEPGSQSFHFAFIYLYRVLTDTCYFRD